jgi:hypothetical protein
MSIKPPTIFETPRLYLRPPIMDDAVAIFAQYRPKQRMS